MAGVGGAAVPGRPIGWRAGTPAPPGYFHINLHSNGGTGFQPVQAQAKACGYHKLLFDCNSVEILHGVLDDKITVFQPPEGQYFLYSH
jgi:hypothetical protein